MISEVGFRIKFHLTIQNYASGIPDYFVSNCMKQACSRADIPTIQLLIHTFGYQEGCLRIAAKYDNKDLVLELLNVHLNFVFTTNFSVHKTTLF